MLLEGRVALITGGAAGIGRATVLRFAREGACVVIADRAVDDGAATQAEIAAAGGDSVFLSCDVTDERQVQAAVESCRERFRALHVLVTAAGILQGAFVRVEELDQATFARVLDVNVLGTFLACKHAVPLIEQSGGGVILCLSSGGGVRGPSSSLAYGASKAAVHGFCLTLERQLAPRGIRVNCICPGAIDTNMKRQNLRDSAAVHGQDPEAVLAATQLGDPDGIARVLTLLASDEADYLLGTIVTR